MGKYDSVIKKLPREMPGGEPKFREKVEARKREIGAETVSLSGLAQSYKQLRSEKDKIGEEESALNVEIAAIEELMHTAFEAEGLTSVKLADGSSVSVSEEPSATIVDRDRLLEWIKANGYERLLTIYSQTVGSLAKEILLEGGEQAVDADGNLTVMGGAVRVTSRRKTTLRR